MHYREDVLEIMFSFGNSSARSVRIPGLVEFRVLSVRSVEMLHVLTIGVRTTNVTKA